MMASDLIVTVKQGSLRGKEEKTCFGDTYYAFKGIPYAKPPIGNLRFKAPQPADSWQGVLDATKHRSKSVQTDFFLNNDTRIQGSEDCLYLNVYTSESLNNRKEKTLKPVMVWIHGGAFLLGSGDSSENGPDYFITHDIVMVTINYRLGVFGFLKVDDPSVEVPGNAGLKDMVLALKWVQENISNFGGDRNNVTIFGVSAGGAAVQFLTLSELTKGLFHKAIIESGSAANPWALVLPDYKPLQELAKNLDIKETEEKKIFEEIQKLSSTDLIKAQIKNKWKVENRPLFTPTIEKPLKEPAFLTQHPLDVIKSGKCNMVPMIIGYTSREGMLTALDNDCQFQDFESLIPCNLCLPKGSPKSLEIAQEIAKFYYGGQEISTDNLDITFAVTTDVYFLNGIYETMKEYIKVCPEKVFLYRYSMDSKHSFVKSLMKVNLPGACHGDDVIFRFRLSMFPLKIIPNSIEDLAMKRFCKLWTNFAKYGNPNPREKNDLINVTWEPLEENKFNYLEFGENLSVGINPDWKRIKFWEKILQTVHK